MNKNNISDTVFDRLSLLYSYTSNVDLCMDTGNEQVYIVRTAPAETWKLFETVSMISNTNLVRIWAIKSDDDTLQVLCEYVPGISLTAYLREKGVLAQEEAFRFIAEICNGLQALHEKGIVHRDINPNNIVVTPDGHIKIIDFGIARSFVAKKQKDTMILGTPGYAAPEQFGFFQSDARTDIYALGVLLNEMMTGHMPGERIPEGVAGKIVRKCTAMDADKRYNNVAEVRNEITGERTNPVDWLMSQIPGLRSPKRTTAILAFIAYFLVAFFTVMMFITVKDDRDLLIKNIGTWFLCFPIPHFCFHNVFNIWNLFPYIKNASLHTKKKLFGVIGLTILIVGVFLFGIINMMPV